ncbi:hypothetical protein AVEN_233568-1 [Araneus ventricosus]|uniref:Uncharacterized protein n=1 Tax=Araneus ventricosus TaxID=182803 RepID=A0A4Y2TXU2_ARAVE|nr:hypothetical protein AVEN_233568-1 [Araneus ventricosus]
MVQGKSIRPFERYSKKGANPKVFTLFYHPPVREHIRFHNTAQSSDHSQLWTLHSGRVELANPFENTRHFANICSDDGDSWNEFGMSAIAIFANCCMSSVPSRDFKNNF